MARNPSANRLLRLGPLSSSAVPSCAAGESFVRIGAVRAAEPRNVAPFTANATAGEPIASSTPPTAGPSARVRFATVAVMEFAAVRSSSPTRAGVAALTAGK